MILLVGNSPAIYTAAIYLRTANISVSIFQTEDIYNITDGEKYPGYLFNSIDELLMILKKQADNFSIEYVEKEKIDFKFYDYIIYDKKNLNFENGIFVEGDGLLVEVAGRGCQVALDLISKLN